MAAIRQCKTIFAIWFLPEILKFDQEASVLGFRSTSAR